MKTNSLLYIILFVIFIIFIVIVIITEIIQRRMNWLAYPWDRKIVNWEIEKHKGALDCCGINIAPKPILEQDSKLPKTQTLTMDQYTLFLKENENDSEDLSSSESDYDLS